MLGDGMVSLGVAVVTRSRRKSNASPKMVSDSVIGSATRTPADSKSTSPVALRMCTWIFWSVVVMPPRA